MKKLIIILFALLALAGCKGEKTMTYEQITQEEAKKIMDTQTDYVLLDTRTDEEFAQGHIEGAIMIPEYEITEKAESGIEADGGPLLPKFLIHTAQWIKNKEKSVQKKGHNFHKNLLTNKQSRDIIQTERKR